MPRGTRNGIALTAVLDRNHPKRREWTQGLENGVNETIQEQLEAVEKALPGLLKDIEKYLVNG